MYLESLIEIEIKKINQEDEQESYEQNITIIH